MDDVQTRLDELRDAAQGDLSALADSPIYRRAVTLLAVLARFEKLEEIAEAAEQFLGEECTCAGLQDQGAICKSCGLDERFKGLDLRFRIELL